MRYTRKAIRDQQWILNSARREGFKGGLEEGEIRLIPMAEIVGVPIIDAASLRRQSLKPLSLMTAELRTSIKTTSIPPSPSFSMGGWK